jgi:hypothetical protein
MTSLWGLNPQLGPPRRQQCSGRRERPCATHNFSPRVYGGGTSDRGISRKVVTQPGLAARDGGGMLGASS